MKKNYVELSPQRRALLKYIFVMKAIWILLISSVIQVAASSSESYGQSAKLNLNLKNVSLEQLIWSIEKQTEFNFFYNSEDVSGIEGININQKGATAEKILSEILDETGLTYEIVHKTIIIKKETKKPVPVIQEEELAEQPQEKTITGAVKDTKGLPLPGVTIILKGTTIGTVTNFDGNFSLSVPLDAKIISISFVGMKSQEIELGNQINFNIVMEDQAVGLDEVVVVGYGQQKKMTVTGAISGVNSEQLVQSPVANISNSLAGRATGVLARQNSGAPGEDQAEIRIRGISTFAGSQEPLILVDGVESSSFNNIDPNEIENISILKDASSTAVYGVRGANGVILITTKRGKTGRPKISLSSNVAATTITEYRERMNAYEYTSLYEKALQYDSYISGTYTQFFTDEEIQKYKDHSDPIFYPDVDWMEMMYKDWSLQTQHNLNITGGTEKVKYFVSLGFFDQEAQFNNTDLQEDFFDQQTVYQRYNFRSNFDFQVTKRLSVKFNVSSKIENKRGINSDEVIGLIRLISLANPIGTPALVDGKFVTLQMGKTGRLENPFDALYAGHRKTYKNNLEGSIRLDYDLGFITKGLNAHGTISFDNYNMYYVQYTKPRERYTAVLNANNEMVLLSNYEDGAFSSSTSSGKRRQTYTEVGLDYTKTINNDHNISAMLLYNQQKKFNPGYAYAIPVGYQGLVGRITYDYKNRYLVEYNAGYNGTENFAPGKRFGYFPAYSLGWVLSEESFFPKNDIVSFIKIRGSYGEVGNDQIGGSRFLYLPGVYTYQSGNAGDKNNAYYWGEVGSTTTGYSGAYEGKIGNPDVTWERSIKSNAGFELTLFKDKIRIIADVFKENRDNILMNPQIQPLSGLGDSYMPALNDGKVENKGIDGEISYNGKIKDFWYRRLDRCC